MGGVLSNADVYFTSHAPEAHPPAAQHAVSQKQGPLVSHSQPASSHTQFSHRQSVQQAHGAAAVVSRDEKAKDEVATRAVARRKNFFMRSAPKKECSKCSKQ